MTLSKILKTVCMSFSPMPDMPACIDRGVNGAIAAGLNKDMEMNMDVYRDMDTDSVSSK